MTYTHSLVLVFLLTPIWIGKQLEAQHPSEFNRKQIWSDEFEKDSRDQYQSKGNVKWEAGKLILEPNAILLKAFGDRTSVALDLRFDPPLLPEDAGQIYLLFRFYREKGLPSILEVYSVADKNGLAWLVRLVDVTKEVGNTTKGKLYRTMRFDLEPIETMSVEYHHGMVIAKLNGKAEFRSFVQKRPADIGAIFVQNSGKSLGLDQLKLSASNLSDRLTETEIELLDEANRLENKFLRLLTSAKSAQALSFIEKATSIRKQVYGAFRPEYATSLALQAKCEIWLGNLKRAQQLCRQVYLIRKRALGTSHPEFAEAAANLGTVFALVHDNAAAIPFLKTALEIYKLNYDASYPDYLSSLESLGRAYLAIGNKEKGHALLLAAFEHRRQDHENRKLNGDLRPGFAYNLLDMAEIHEDKGDLDAAARLIREGLELHSQLMGKAHPMNSFFELKLANLIESQGEVTKAETILLEALDKFRKSQGGDHPDNTLYYGQLGSYYLRRGEVPKAKKWFRACFDLELNTAMATLPTMSNLQATIWKAKGIGSVDNILDCLRRDEGNNPAEVYSYVWLTKSVASRLRKPYQIPVEVDSSEQELFDELRRARKQLAGLVSAVPDGDDLDGHRSAIQTTSARKDELEMKLARTNQPLAREIAIRDATVNQLLHALPVDTAVVDFVIHKSVKNTVGAKTNRSGGDSKSSGDSQDVYDVFVLRKAPNSEEPSIVWIELGSCEPIDSAINAWRKALLNENAYSENVSKLVSEIPNARSSEVLGRELREMIWDEIEPHLSGCRSLFILPDGRLNSLAWSALPGKQPQTFLIEDYGFTVGDYAQQILGWLRNAAPTTSRCLVVGGLDYERPQYGEAISGEYDDQPQVDMNPSTPGSTKPIWPELPGAAAELALLSSYWPKESTRISLSGIQADETAVAAALPKCRFAHFATHGYFETEFGVYQLNLRNQSITEDIDLTDQTGGSIASRNPFLLSGIVLSGANSRSERDEFGVPTGNDGLLTAEEIRGLDLRNLDLITLSACETGLGDIIAGEGVFGLQRAFHQAGARSVIASLWKVDDQATQALMVEFYKNLWNKKMSKIEALRQAQLTMLNSYDKETGSLRGFGDKSVPVTGKNKNSTGRLNPRYWAAFQLSGDWR